MESQGFEEINHTADLALRVWGEGFHDLLIQAARGLYYLFNINTVGSSCVFCSFAIAEGPQDVMLVDFLNELIYLCEVKQKKFDVFSFRHQQGQLIIECQGISLTSHQRSIKAATFHDLEIIESEGILGTTVTFDV